MFDEEVKIEDLYLSEEELENLNEDQLKFIKQAHAACLQYVIEDGEPIAWGVAVEGVFDMSVNILKNQFDGYLVTLRD